MDSWNFNKFMAVSLYGSFSEKSVPASNIFFSTNDKNRIDSNDPWLLETEYLVWCIPSKTLQSNHDVLKMLSKDLVGGCLVVFFLHGR